MLDPRDILILDAVQRDDGTSLEEIGARVHLSPSACSRRIAALRRAGYIDRSVAVLDRRKLGIPTTLFIIIRVSVHTDEWTRIFRQALSEIPEIVEAHRVTGNFDYILKMVLPNVEHYDVVYKTLIGKVPMHEVSAYISMETVKDAGPLPLSYAPVG